MTTPGSDPAETVPPDPVPSPDEIAAQAALNDQIRNLAAEIAKQTLLEFDPATYRKGAVISIQSAAAPPTLTVTISGDTLEIPGVRYYDHYSPAVGDVVHILKQGTDITAVGKIAEQYSATGWTLASLNAGFTHNGNSGGNVEFRKVWEGGSSKVEFRGVAGRSSGTNLFALPTGYQPGALRPLLARRNDSGGSVSVGLDFGTNVTMVGGTTGSHSHSVDVTDNAHTHDINNHAHGVSITDNDHTHDVNNHRHGVNITDNAHNHSGGGLTAVTINGFTDTESGLTASGTAVTINGTTDTETGITAQGTAVTINGDTGTQAVTDPTWISFNGLEIWL